jgi:glycogen(starch) synthase
MRIVIHSPAFYPMIGGLEAFAAMLAGGLQGRGHEVVVLCQSEKEADKPEPFPFRVVRRPSFLEMARWMSWSEVVVHAQISLKGLLPWLVARRPLLVSHQTWLREAGGAPLTWQTRLKRLMCRLAVNVTCSAAVGQDLGLPHQVIPNPYNEALFKARPEVARSRDLLFVGRLVSDKGADLLLEAVAQMAATGVCLTTTITGSGPEEDALKSQVTALGLTEQVRFTGPLSGEALARMMNAHRVLVVPSRWEEPFGIVALEGLASGCTVVASDGGGLPEAAGPVGLLFESESLDALTLSLQRALLMFPGDGVDHLRRHQRGSVVEEYERLLSKMKRGRLIP